jgi:hypothetical protein
MDPPSLIGKLEGLLEDTQEIRPVFTLSAHRLSGDSLSVLIRSCQTARVMRNRKTGCPGESRRATSCSVGSAARSLTRPSAFCRRLSYPDALVTEGRDEGVGCRRVADLRVAEGGKSSYARLRVAEGGDERRCGRSVVHLPQGEGSVSPDPRQLVPPTSRRRSQGRPRWRPACGVDQMHSPYRRDGPSARVSAPGFRSSPINPSTSPRLRICARRRHSCLMEFRPRPFWFI